MKHVVITGANRGIGLELARHYQSEGWRVTGVCRESSSELDEVAKQIIEGIDVTSKDFVDLLVAALQGQTIDLLINNAGVLLDETLGELDFDSLRLQMEINAFAPSSPTMPRGAISSVTSTTSLAGPCIPMTRSWSSTIQSCAAPRCASRSSPCSRG